MTAEDIAHVLLGGLFLLYLAWPPKRQSHRPYIRTDTVLRRPDPLVIEGEVIE